MAMVPAKAVDPVGVEFARQFHDVYRRSRMNAIYYGARLARTQRANFWYSVAVGLGTSASVAGLAVWRSHPGQAAFGVLAALAVVLQAVRPALDLSGQIARLSKLWTTYGGAFETLDRLHAELSLRGGRVASAEEQLFDVMARVSGVVAAEDPQPKSKLLSRSQADAERELPFDRLWMPSANDDPSEDAEPDPTLASAAASEAGPAQPGRVFALEPA